MNAVHEIEEEAGQPIELVVFGDWGSSFNEPADNPVPHDKRGVLLSRDEAMAIGGDWSCWGDFGLETSYAVHAWTRDYVLWITRYDGSTTIDKITRHPSPAKPEMRGG